MKSIDRPVRAIHAYAITEFLTKNKTDYAIVTEYTDFTYAVDQATSFEPEVNNNEVWHAVDRWKRGLVINTSPGIWWDCEVWDTGVYMYQGCTGEWELTLTMRDGFEWQTYRTHRKTLKSAIQVMQKCLMPQKYGYPKFKNKGCWKLDEDC